MMSGHHRGGECDLGSSAAARGLRARPKGRAAQSSWHTTLRV